MKVLVIGATGSLGRDVVEQLSPTHDLQTPGRAELDLLRPQTLDAAVGEAGVAWVVNCSAFADVDGCQRDPDRAYAVNAVGVGALAQACSAHGARFLHVSTDYVFNGRKGTPYYEDDETGPLNVYGASKLEGERLALDALPESLIVRSSMLMSRWGRNFATRVLEAARANTGEIRAVTDWIGSPTATTDLAAAIGELLSTSASGVLHVTNPGACSRYEQAVAILAAAGATGVDLVPIESATLLQLDAPRPQATPLASRFLSQLGIELPSREDAIARFVGAATS